MTTLPCEVALAVMATSLLISCGAAQPGQRESGDASAVVTIEPPRAKRSAAGDPGLGTTRESEPRFPQTSLTPMATEAAAIVDAAIAGEALPESTWPIRDVREVLDDRRADEDKSSSYEHFAFGIEYWIYFEQVPQQPRRVKTSVVLIPEGLRILELRVHDHAGNPGRDLPAWLSPVAHVSNRFMTAARRGNTQSYRIRTSDLRGQLPGEFYEKLQSDAERNNEAFDHAQQALANVSTDLGYEVDKIAMLSKDQRGYLYGFGIDVDLDDKNQAVLDEPLVTVERVWPED